MGDADVGLRREAEGPRHLCAPTLEALVALGHPAQLGLDLVAVAALGQPRAGREHEQEEHTCQRDDRRDQEPARAPHCDRPRNAAVSPRACSMRRSWLYLAVRSDRAGAPVLIWPQLVA